jgi:hypothetical protein
MEYETIMTVVLCGLIVYFSLDFEKTYATGFHEAARHPFARFLAGMGVAYIANENPKLAVLALITVFFWIADVNLLSSFSM